MVSDRRLRKLGRDRTGGCLPPGDSSRVLDSSGAVLHVTAMNRLSSDLAACLHYYARLPRRAGFRDGSAGSSL